MSELTPLQQRFVEAYLVEPDPCTAAVRAGYSPRRAARSGRENLSHPAVQAALAGAQHARGERTGITRDRVVQELAAIGFATMTDVCRWTGDSLELLDSGHLSPEQAAAIAEISETATTRGGTVRVKLHSKLKALEMLARHVGLYLEKEPDLGGRADGAPGTGGGLPLSEALRERIAAMYGETGEAVDATASGGDDEMADPDADEA